MHEPSPLVDVVAGIILLLVIAAAVFALGKRIRLPFTVMLVVVGVGITWATGALPQLSVLRSISLTPDMILYIFVPTLIFESAFNMDARRLWRNILPVLTLAVPGLLLSTGIIGGIVAALTDIPLAAALLLGAILSATDPVAVIALFRKLGAPQRLTVLVEGESLFNDATAIVLATILLTNVEMEARTGADALTLGGAVMEFGLVFFGGMALGALLGMVTGLLLGMVRADVYIETTLTTVLAYASFILAEQVFHVSGVVTVVLAGLTLGNWGRIKISPQVRRYVDHFWEYMAFVATALIFLMVGMRVELAELWLSAGALAWVVVGMLLSRAMVIYGMIPLSNAIPGGTVTGRAYQHVLFWGGLRGAVALAIVLSLPPFPYHDQFIALVMGAVLFTLLVQGLSIEWLVGLLGLNKPPLTDRLARAEGSVTALQLALDRLPELQRGGLFSGSIAHRLQRYCKGALEEQQQALRQLRHDELDRNREIIQLYLRCFASEQAQYNDLFNKGHLSEKALRSLLGELALQIESLRSHGGSVFVASHQLPQRPLQRVLHRLLERTLGNLGVMERLRLAYIVLGYEEAWGHYHACHVVLDDLDELQAMTGLDAGVVEDVRQRYRQWQAESEQAITQMTEQYPEFISAMQERLGMRLILLAQVQAIREDTRGGIITEEVSAQMLDELYRRLWELRGQEITRLQVEPDELLKKVPFFADIPAAEFQALSRHMKRHSANAFETIISQGESGDSLYLIARGVVRVSREEDGTSRDLTSLFAGDFFGEMALLQDEKRSATVTSLTPCTFYVLSRRDLLAVMDQQPVIRQALEKAADSRLREQRATPSG